MGYAAKVLRDSVSPNGLRLTTMEVTFPRIVLAEFNTHRVFSRNSASSRAIPVEKRIAAIEADPFIPEAFGKNTKGMQAVEDLAFDDQQKAELVWRFALRDALEHARHLASLGVHKQLANRLIEPFGWQTVIVSATEWDNFFGLRRDANAQPEIRKGADMMYEVYSASRPVDLTEDEWHLPLVDDYDDLIADGFSSEDIVKICVGRCARVSYLTHDGTRDPRADVQLYERLYTGGHMSPLEHAARPMNALELDCLRRYTVEFEDGTLLPNVSLPTGVMSWEDLIVGGQYRVKSVKETYFLGNLNGWVQARKEVKHEENFILAQALRGHELKGVSR